MHRLSVRLCSVLLMFALPGFATAAVAQERPSPGTVASPATASEDWHVMQDGVIYGLFNQQGGPRGGREFVVPNWWMGMAIRKAGRHQFSLNGMFSLDPATVGKSGYREIFQVGETLDDKPLIDHQHPHDLFMQLAGAWRIDLPRDFALTVSGGPVGEPTLGPIAFMHRPSASGLILAPLGHHTFDSTHISFGVIGANGQSKLRYSTAASLTRIAGTSISAGSIHTRRERG
jgi:hypothetical protein